MAPFVGRALKAVRAGESKLSWTNPDLRGPETITLSSPVFAADGSIPQRYAGRGVGDDISPPLAWTGVPSGAAELVLIIEDADAPLPRPFVHCTAHGIPADLDGLAEGALSAATASPRIKIARAYVGPRPVRGHGPHRYSFQIFALGTAAGLPVKVSLKHLIAAASGHVISRGRLDGWFELS